MPHEKENRPVDRFGRPRELTELEKKHMGKEKSSVIYHFQPGFGKAKEPTFAERMISQLEEEQKALNDRSHERHEEARARWAGFKNEPGANPERPKYADMTTLQLDLDVLKETLFQSQKASLQYEMSRDDTAALFQRMFDKVYESWMRKTVAGVMAQHIPQTATAEEMHLRGSKLFFSDYIIIEWDGEPIVKFETDAAALDRMVKFMNEAK